MTKHFYAILPSPFGELVLTSNGEAITGLYTPENSHYKKAKQGTNEPKYFKEATKQLNEYFAGKRRDFDLPLATEGTEFQNLVWKNLQKIKAGKTKSYGELAASLGKPTASRAVGNANGKNPISIIVPCHRVLHANGGLGGYNGKLSTKKWLLEHEAKMAG